MEPSTRRGESRSPKPRTSSANGRFGAEACEAVAPSFRLSNSNINPLDINGDGRVEFVDNYGLQKYSYYRLKHEGPDPLEGYFWEDLGPFEDLGSYIDFTRDARRVRMVDVNNDRLIDVVGSISGDILTYLNLSHCPGGEDLFGTPRYDAWGNCTGFETEPIVSCGLLRSGLVEFSERGVRIADMNGDGLQDLVRARSGDIVYWPNRGNGSWGDGDRVCEEGALSYGRGIEMDPSPLFDSASRKLHLADVNGDGTADLIFIGSRFVEVQLNQNGTSLSKKISISQTPPCLALGDAQPRLVDLNGSGSVDIVWGDASRFKYLDLTGGVQPRLLARIDNGLGASTEIHYRPSTFFRAQDETRGQPWESHAPMPVTVVAETVVRDGLGQEVTKRYDYRDPVYDESEGDFHGFRQAMVTMVGDESTPTAVTVSSFFGGERPAWACDGVEGERACSLVDNPYESLKGAPYLAETRTDPAGATTAPNPWNHAGAAYLESTHTSYVVDKLYEGADGRGVWFAWPAQTDSFRYSQESWRGGGAPSEALPRIRVQSRLAGGEASELGGETGEVAAPRGSGSARSPAEQEVRRPLGPRGVAGERGPGRPGGRRGHDPPEVG